MSRRVHWVASALATLALAACQKNNLDPTDFACQNADCDAGPGVFERGGEPGGDQGGTSRVRQVAGGGVDSTDQYQLRLSVQAVTGTQEGQNYKLRLNLPATPAGP